MPLTASVPPLLILASVNWMPVAACTPGTSAAADDGARGSALEVLALDDQVARDRAGRSRPGTTSLKPFTNTATNTTRATPIISAAEVTAVRPGLRNVFSRASRPASGTRHPTATRGAAGATTAARGRRRSRAPRQADQLAGADTAGQQGQHDRRGDQADPDVAERQPVADPPQQRPDERDPVADAAQEPPDAEHQLQRAAQHGGGRRDQQPRQHRHAEEREDRAGGHGQQDPGAASAAVDARTAISPTPIAATATPIHGTYGASLPRRQLGALAQRRDRRHAGRLHGRRDGRDQRRPEADGQRQQHAPDERDRDRGGRQVDARRR